MTRDIINAFPSVPLDDAQKRDTCHRIDAHEYRHGQNPVLQNGNTHPNF